MTAPTPSGGGMPQQPTAELQQQEQERQRERMPRVLRSYASAFDRGHVSDSDAGLYVRRAADEIDSLRAALLAARADARALRDALTHVADEINAQRRGSLGQADYETRRYWAQVEGVARDALAAATPERDTREPRRHHGSD